MTSRELGLKKKVRKTPVATSTTKQYIAISPNMNDQWSGKTLLSAVRVKLVAPSRSSIHRPSRPITPPVLPARPVVALLGRVGAGRPAGRPPPRLAGPGPRRGRPQDRCGGPPPSPA